LASEPAVAENHRAGDDLAVELGRAGMAAKLLERDRRQDLDLNRTTAHPTGFVTLRDLQIIGWNRPASVVRALDDADSFADGFQPPDMALRECHRRAA